MPARTMRLTLTIVLAACRWLPAAPVSVDEATAAAVSFVRSVCSGTDCPEPAGEPMAVIDAESGATLGYVVGLNPAGFVATSADTEIAPVISHSLSCDFPKWKRAGRVSESGRLHVGHDHRLHLHQR